MTTLTPADPRWPSLISARLEPDAPHELHLLGNLDLLALPKTALFCSARCPGEAILRAHGQAAKWRDEGRCVISGFHSPVERDCLRILLRGQGPVVVCPARSLPKRVPSEWEPALAAGRMLLLTPFGHEHRRISAALAARRNDLVAALADELWFAHITPGGRMEQLARRFGAIAQ